jgi:hypothetical protein
VNAVSVDILDRCRVASRSLPHAPVRPPALTLGGSVMRRPAATLLVVWALAILQLFVWLFALTFVAMGVLGIAALDLLVWIEFGAVAGAVHLAVVAAMLLRRAARPTCGAIAT